MSENFGVVTRAGWEKDEETGKEVFRATIEYPNGPPYLPFDVIWERKPVDIVLRSVAPHDA